MDVQSELLSLTCRLVRLSTDLEKVEGIASGFIYKKSESFILLSAGHVFKNREKDKSDRWCLETNVFILDENGEERRPLIPLNGVLWFQTFALDTLETELIDIACVPLDIDALKSEAMKIASLRDKPIEFRCYQGPLDHEPIRDERLYSYVSWHSRENTQYVERSPSDYLLVRKPTGELQMTYKGRTSDGKLYRFALAGDHKGDEYYKGASGSPIADPTGKIVSMLLDGNPSANLLYGLPMRDYTGLFDLDLHRL